MTTLQVPEIRYVPLVTTQPDGVRWPTDEWPTGPAPSGVDVDGLVAELFDDDGPLAATFAAVVVHRGRLIAERYAGEIVHWDGPDEPVTSATRLLSWSMAKSIAHAVVGTLVLDGALDPAEPSGVPEWQADDDPRRAITLQDLLEMRDGLDWSEVYELDTPSDVVAMLFGDGKDDMAVYAISKPLAVAPGTRFSYSSGTSNIVSSIVARHVGRGDEYRDYLNRRIFGPIGMSSAVATFDEAGTFVASSYVHATARDYARFGYWYLRGGVWEGERLLPEGWVDHGRTARSVDPEDGHLYGAHWWVVDDAHGTFKASGYEGQSILVVPGLDLVVVRLGKTPEEMGEHLVAWQRRVVDAFAAGAPAAEAASGSSPTRAPAGAD